MSTMFFPILVVAQMLNRDPNFPVLNEIRWDMRTNEIESLCGNRWKETSSTDSSMVYSSSFFGAATKTVIQIDPKSKQPRMINICFEEATDAMRDTLLNYFTLITGKSPVITTKEKSAIVFTLKLEMALWKLAKETVGVMTAMRGSSIVALSLILTPMSLAQK
jgi:hypothetical protein